MNSSPVTELVQNANYRIYSDGGCREMETTVYRTFVGMSQDGYALFYDASMGCPVIYDRSWTFYRI
jgi:hypothetical protein